MSRVIDAHHLYLADAARLLAYQSAITSLVKPGDIVLDLASGTGVLGLFACRAGAARVYAIDGGGMAGPARAIARENGLDDRVHVIHGFSREVTLPERADILVTDQIGHFGFEAGIVQFVADARRRLLKPDARLVPSRIDLLIAPVEAPDVFDGIEFWTRQPAGFRMDSLREMAASSGHPRTIGADQLLAPAVAGGAIDLHADQASITVSASATVTREGTLHGIGGWFSATLAPGVTMSNAPLAANRITRRGVVFPIRTATPVAAGDRIAVRMRILPADMLVSWTVDVARGAGARPVTRFQHSTLGGMLIDPEQLRRTRHDFVPRLTERGRARLSVLELCDGSRPLAAVEREVLARHPALFADPAEAAVFVAEVVAGYSE